MKRFLLTSVAALAGSVAMAAEVPEVLNVFSKDKFVKAATIAVIPPPELDKYVAIVEQEAKKDPEWFKEHSKKAPPGVPLPYDPKLGLTQDQYKEYMEIWAKREYKQLEPVVLSLIESAENEWVITTPGSVQPITTLKYITEKDVFESPNGTLQRLEDVDADKHSILGAWAGHEWKFETENSLGETRENIAIGKTDDKKFGLLVYRMQEVTSLGSRLYDKSLVIRFPLGEAGILKPEELQRK